MKYHLWCTSSSYVDDSIHLLLFQRTLISTIAKWYIDLPRSTYYEFNFLAMAFLTHFQFLVRYQTDTYFLTSLKQNTVTHISDHIHECRHRDHLIKFEISDQLLTKWFTKSFVSPIAHDIAMGGCIMEEQAISRAEYLDLLYSQFGTFYESLPDAPSRSSDPMTSNSQTTPPIDGVIGSVSQAPAKYSSKRKSASNTASNSPSQNPPGLGKTS